METRAVHTSRGSWVEVTVTDALATKVKLMLSTDNVNQLAKELLEAEVQRRDEAERQTPQWWKKGYE